MKKISLKNVVWKEGKHYVAQCLNIDIASFGTTKKDALLKLDEALQLYFEDTKSPKLQKIERPEVVTISLKYVQSISPFLHNQGS